MYTPIARKNKSLLASSPNHTLSESKITTTSNKRRRL